MFDMFNMNSPSFPIPTTTNTQNQNIPMEYTDTSFPNPSSLFPQIQPKIKIDDILTSIKSLTITPSIQSEIRSAIKLLNRFKLHESSKWCSELLQSTFLPQQQPEHHLSTEPLSSSSNPIQCKNLTSLFNNSNQPLSSPSSPTTNTYASLYASYKQLEHPIKDTLTYASTLINLKEYHKCKQLLSPYASTPQYQTAMYYYYYCSYMITSQQSHEELLNNNDTSSFKYSSSSDLNKLQVKMNTYETSFSPFMCYLYAVVLKDLKRVREANAYFIKSLNAFPYLWSCWIELEGCLKNNSNDFTNILPLISDHYMKYFYLSNYLLEKNYEIESIQVLTALSNVFNNNLFILNSLAHAYYLLHEYETSLEYFEKLFNLDPNRYENLDTYSNILFIKENYCELSNLAYKCYINDKYRPESCCVIGNYYALKGDHPKAVAYFKRAVKLDYTFLPAWTLMGHEYLEMKIIPAAIESYRTAVDIDSNDYRAWYGLGQTYEILQIYNFAIYYFINAAKAKPNDSRMWTAIGLCYEKLDKKMEAIQCYEKANSCNDREGIALYKMAKLYMEIDDYDKAAICFKENLNRNLNEDIDTDEMIESCVFLARYYKSKGEYEEAVGILMKLKDYEGKEKDEILSLMREVSNVMSSTNNTNS